MPVLSALHQSPVGARTTVLAATLGASRDALRLSLRVLQDARLVARNPGHGHPLRPEYVLTTSGRALAAACARYVEATDQMRLGATASRKWTAPTLLVASRANMRFGELQSALAGISPRALTAVLRSLTRLKLMGRHLADEFPPYASYQLTRRGEHVAELVLAIATRC